MSKEAEEIQRMRQLSEGSKRKLTFHEYTELDPIEKYRTYGTFPVLSLSIGKFPWKLVLHFILAIVTSIQCLIMIRGTFGHTRAEMRYFYYWFVNSDVCVPRE